MPKEDGSGPPKGTLGGRRDGSGKGTGRYSRTGKGIGTGKGGRKGSCLIGKRKRKKG